MRVKVGDYWHDTGEEPIAIEFSPIERLIIQQLPATQNIFIQHPKGISPADVEIWFKSSPLVQMSNGNRIVVPRG